MGGRATTILSLQNTTIKEIQFFTIFKDEKNGRGLGNTSVWISMGVVYEGSGRRGLHPLIRHFRSHLAVMYIQLFRLTIIY